MRITAKRSLHIREPAFQYTRLPAAGASIGAIVYGWTMWARQCRTTVEAALPDAGALLYFNLGPTGRHLVSPGAVGPSASPRAAWVVGPRARVLLIAKEIADSHVIGVRLQAGVVERVLGVPAAAIREQVIDLEHFWGREVEHLRERLFELRSAAQRLALLQGEIARRAVVCATDDQLRALCRNLENGGRVSVGKLASQFGLSHRRLIALFDNHVGLKPKEYQRVNRLRAAVEQIDNAPSLSYSAAAYDVGYCDQAHLANEFRRLAGVTMSDYAARRSPLSDGFYRYQVVSSR